MAGDYLKTIESRLDKFLTHPSKRVLLLKGKWGVGKTFFWNNIFIKNRLKNQGGLLESDYAYVSLFGVESGEQIEDLIIANSIKIGEADALDKASALLRRAMEWVDHVPKLREFSGLAKRFGRMFIKDVLLCIDDVERKAKTLSMANVMGLASVLREHNNCRTVFIMNDDELQGDDLKEFEKYREKVIDEIINYAPETKDNVRLIFDDDPYIQHYVDIFSTVKINNLRIMQQVKWVNETFSRYFAGLETAISNQLREHIALLTCFFHDPSLGIDVSNLRQMPLSGINQGVGDETKTQADLARSYGYLIEEYDFHLAEFLMHGMCDEKEFEADLLAASQREKQGQVYSKYR